MVSLVLSGLIPSSAGAKCGCIPVAVAKSSVELACGLVIFWRTIGKCWRGRNLGTIARVRNR